MATSKYIYPKRRTAGSYKDEVVRRVALMQTQGALIEMKEYTKRPPSKYTEQFDIDGQYLRDSESVFVVLINSKSKSLINATLVGREIWLRTIKVNDRDLADEMLAHADNLLRHVEREVNERASKRKRNTR